MLAQADLECKECHGPLCVVGQQVECERCGVPVSDHPFTRNKATQSPPVSVNISHHENPASIPERLLKLEQLFASMTARFDRLEAKAKK